MVKLGQTKSITMPTQPESTPLFSASGAKYL
jgi:hypothetical protein